MRCLRVPAAAAARGVTLIELMVGLAVLAVLVAAAAPYMGDMVMNSRLRESGNLLFAETLIAQSEAIKRNTNVRVSTGADTVQVHDMTTPGAPVLLRARSFTDGVTAPVGNFTFGPEGRPAPFGTAVSINLSMTGATCSTELRCPGLRVDAGGAARLCANQQVSCP
ncbi:MAG: GspH/FimT family pseudopilin [Rubrivivax sp.]|jgi:type IV fimbrial biogenesis protein FimT|nr:GspH/FimT family pseudopilin [Rubrivivax sp.]